MGFLLLAKGLLLAELISFGQLLDLLLKLLLPVGNRADRIDVGIDLGLRLLELRHQLLKALVPRLHLKTKLGKVALRSPAGLIGSGDGPLKVFGGVLLGFGRGSFSLLRRY